MLYSRIIMYILPERTVQQGRDTTYIIYFTSRIYVSMAQYVYRESDMNNKCYITFFEDKVPFSPNELLHEDKLRLKSLKKRYLKIQKLCFSSAHNS